MRRGEMFEQTSWPPSGAGGPDLTTVHNVK